MGTQLVASVSLRELILKLQDYAEQHPEDVGKMIYFDALHIKGDVLKYGDDLLELI